MSGKVILLNGSPRAGKSTIAEAIQRQEPGEWLNFGVDVFIHEILPEELKPGIGLRPPVPGDEGVAAKLGPFVAPMYRVFHQAIRAFSDEGLNVVADVGYHDSYADPERDARECFNGLTVLFVGVRCPLATIIDRRHIDQAGRHYAKADEDQIPLPILRWQEEVHRDRIYDLEVDTSLLTPEACAAAVLMRLVQGSPFVFHSATKTQ